MRVISTGLIATALLLTACGSDDDATDAAVATDAPAPDTTAPEPATTGAEPSEPSDASEVSEQQFPDVVDATATFDGATWTIAATLSSPYDTPERYADSWRVVGPDGTVYGERFLTHDHANEQPFTRSQSGIEIPEDVTTVTIEGRDQQYGWGGGTFELTLDR